ncbi:MAG TPA: flavin reductase family protein [Cyclobacteriaceae bacterium]|nr:flavin reductase family protein [Cyclobacteriaceae bacterium]HMV08677.1 flavin reductase family protein [Cyclobacteriaceae bacterium]HMV91728.1 flavin reductase family protein [Cyclobacteriaceae bacterium]HMX00114.1 flavin reductase family protein [Cyclobacteriaceae bacterium]HMX49024.1 flavin reductase family protein [Cyclobacteriaceae bacterium]
MITINPKDLAVPKLQAYLQSAVSPRPIAFVSSIDKSGNVNLSPFSFFNMFSMNPPILVFSPSRRVRDNSEKHTLENIREVDEVVINIVNYNMVQQTSLASCDFPKGVNEFVKSGLTPEASQMVKPPRVKESPVAFECKVKQVIALGDQGGAGNLVLCEVLLMHIRESVVDANGIIDPYKIDAVARMGQNYYCRAQGDNIFVVPKPNEKVGIGYDKLPEHIRNSKVLSGNDLGMLANVESIPSASKPTGEEGSVISRGAEAAHQLAQSYLRAGKIEDAWRVLQAI